MTYRDPLEAARARIAALEDLLDTQGFTGPVSEDEERAALRHARAALAEERAENEARHAELQAELATLEQRLAEAREELVDERARRQAEVSLLRTKLEEAERAVQHNASLFEAEQTMQRAEAEAEAARLRQQLVHKDTQIRELREEIRVHLGGDARAIRAHYAARVRAVGTELAEHGTLARRLDASLKEAREALDALPPADERDREGMVERELAKRKVAVGEAELRRVRERITRLEAELERITAAEAALAERS
ncbi:MAG TPA: hypothetical protein RMH99_09605 [Sandaracinaceae bacterium LLY-WYZ-13_1]|nr:hypothetical protein [Sandaracinaceae bacterium LLY-WYZ-13_1]